MRGSTMTGADVLIVADDPDRTERELAAGELACPDALASCARGDTPVPGGCALATDADTCGFGGAAAPTASAPTCSCPG